MLNAVIGYSIVIFIALLIIPLCLKFLGEDLRHWEHKEFLLWGTLWPISFIIIIVILLLEFYDWYVNKINRIGRKDK
jgi:hypothetical protein